MRSAVAWCEKCQRVVPATVRGACKLCKARDRRARGRVKALANGTPLATFSDWLHLADDLWSAWVRAKASGCRMCGAPLPPERLQCAHGWTRTDRIIRFHPDNTFALCAACHMRHTPPRPAWYAWMLEQLGESRYDDLERRSKLGGKLGGKLRQSDLELVVLDARQRIAALPEGEHKAWAIERERVLMERVVRLGIGGAIDGALTP